MAPCCLQRGDGGMDSRTPHGGRLHRPPHACTGPTAMNAPHVCELIKRAYDRVQAKVVVLPCRLRRTALRRAESIHSGHRPGICRAEQKSRQRCKWVRQNTTGSTGGYRDPRSRPCNTELMLDYLGKLCEHRAGKNTAAAAKVKSLNGCRVLCV